MISHSHIRRELYIAVDGGAARAKLELQRRRRQSKAKKVNSHLIYISNFRLRIPLWQLLELNLCFN